MEINDLLVSDLVKSVHSLWEEDSPIFLSAREEQRNKIGWRKRESKEEVYIFINQFTLGLVLCGWMFLFCSYGFWNADRIRKIHNHVLTQAN